MTTAENMNENLEKITIAVSWYQALQKGYNDLHTLSEARRKLSTRLFELADSLGGLKSEYNKAYYERKRQMAVITRKYETPPYNESNAKAKISAEIEADSYIKMESETENLFYRVKYLYEAGKDVMDSMTQDISMLKQEKSYTQSHG